MKLTKWGYGGARRASQASYDEGLCLPSSRHSLYSQHSRVVTAGLDFMKPITCKVVFKDCWCFYLELPRAWGYPLFMPAHTQSVGCGRQRAILVQKRFVWRTPRQCGTGTHSGQLHCNRDVMFVGWVSCHSIKARRWLSTDFQRQ